MDLTVTILTTDERHGRKLPEMLQSLEGFQTRVVCDEPDLSLRSLSTADIIVLGPDVSRSRTMMVLRAIDRIQARSRVLMMVPAKETVEQVLGYFGSGARAIVVESDELTEFDYAITQLLRGRRYLSPRLIAPLLERYRYLRTELRRRLGDGFGPAEINRLLHYRA